MLFCESLEITTTTTDIYNKLKNYLDAKNISKENITSCTTDGAPVMMDKNGYLKMMKDENPEVLLVHSVIHRENFVSKNISPVLNEVLKSVKKCINAIKANAKCQHIFKQICEEKNVDNVRLRLHTEVKWFSKGIFFKELFDVLRNFLNYKFEMSHLLTADGKMFVSYLADIFKKLNILNKQL